MDESAKKNSDIEPPQHIQDFIFVRELSEVYLLLDHISGRWDKTLYGNAKLPPPSLDAQEKDWIEKICEIGWPPKGTEAQQAQQAATLLRAKDRLNAAARPATGATIAFTLLVVGEDNPARDVKPSLWRRWMNRMGGAGKAAPLSGDARASDGSGGVPAPRSPAAAGFSSGFGQTPSRVSLASTAFPGLVSIARWFKWEIRAIVLVLFLWLIFTCALSWNVAIGHAILVRLDALQAQKIDIAKRIASTELNAAGRDGKAAPSAIPVFLVCDQPNLVPQAGMAAAPTVPRTPGIDAMHICAERQENSRAEAVGRMNLDDWMVSWRWVKRWQLLTWSSADPAKVAAQGKSEDAAAELMESAGDQEWGRILTVVLANAVLPLCYGFLGAEAAVVRDLWSKMRESLLSPRDLTLALGQLALGAITGACIGLFVSPSGVSLPGESGHVGAIALTGSALSFIAGFGVEGVFVALESLVKRVFNLSDSRQRT